MLSALMSKWAVGMRKNIGFPAQAGFTVKERMNMAEIDSRDPREH